MGQRLWAWEGLTALCVSIPRLVPVLLGLDGGKLRPGGRPQVSGGVSQFVAEVGLRAVFLPVSQEKTRVCFWSSEPQGCASWLTFLGADQAPSSDGSLGSHRCI